MKSKRKTGAARPLWLNVLILLAGTSLVCFVLSLLIQTPISNLFFLAGILLLLIAAVPIFSEVGGNARTGLQARREGKQMGEAIRAEQESGRYSQGTRITFLFGICGFACFILAIATL